MLVLASKDLEDRYTYVLVERVSQERLSQLSKTSQPGKGRLMMQIQACLSPDVLKTCRVNLCEGPFSQTHPESARRKLLLSKHRAKLGVISSL